MQGNLFAKKYKLLVGEIRDFGAISWYLDKELRSGYIMAQSPAISFHEVGAVIELFIQRIVAKEGQMVLYF